MVFITSVVDVRLVSAPIAHAKLQYSPESTKSYCSSFVAMNSFYGTNKIAQISKSHVNQPAPLLQSHFHRRLNPKSRCNPYLVTSATVMLSALSEASEDDTRPCQT